MRSTARPAAYFVLLPNLLERRPCLSLPDIQSHQRSTLTKKKSSILCILFIILSILVETSGSYGRVGVHETGLQFIEEPPSRMLFLNTTGGVLHCKATGAPTPTIQWLIGEDFRPVVPGMGRSSTGYLRTVSSNGSLVFSPFHSSQYRQDVHGPHSYRCLASTSQGTAIVTRSVAVRAVVEQDYEVRVYDENVLEGNSAVLRCHIPTYVNDFVEVVAWLQDSAYVIERTKHLVSHHLTLGSTSDRKHTILEDGSLHITSVDARDGYRTYSCRTNHTLTGRLRDSTPGKLTVTEAQSEVAPRLMVEQRSNVDVGVGGPVVLPCAAQANPLPNYRWSKVSTTGGVGAIIGTGAKFQQKAGLLIIRSATLQDDGRYLCFINNTVGQETVEVTLSVTEPVVALVSPRRLVVDMGKDATFRCAVRGQPIASINWLHNAKPLPRDTRYSISSRDTLIISSVGREDRGMYQCVVTSRPGYSVQSAAILLLGASSPVLAYRFEPRTLQPGPALSLKCVAAGNPPPQFKWALDGFPLPENERFVVGQYVTVEDEVISHVNISHVRVEDGGQYSCLATNSVGSVQHAAGVRVFGSPFIRPMRPVTAVAGAQLVLTCPAAGYPIENIFWKKEGRRLPAIPRQHVHSNGTLVVEATQRGVDGGRYTCTASNRHGHEAHRFGFINKLKKHR